MNNMLKQNKTKNIANSQWIDELSEEEEEVLKHGAEIDNYMRTGKADKRIKIGLLEDIGVKLTSSVSKNTDLDVAADTNEESNKITKAKQLKITILSKVQFYDKIK